MIKPTLLVLTWGVLGGAYMLERGVTRVPARPEPEPQDLRMFRGNAAHTGVALSRLFGGQGGVRWEVHTGGAVRSSPALTATTVFIGSGDGRLYAINRATGRVTWRFDAGNPVDASPAVSNGLVIAATREGRIFAVSESGGQLRWSVQTGKALPLVHAATGWDLIISSPVVSGDRAIIGAADGHVYALGLTTGKILWRGQTQGRVRASPSVAEGMVIVGSFDGCVYAFDLVTGAERWVHHTLGDSLDSQKYGFDRRSIQSSAAVDGGSVYFGSRDDHMYALDARTGARRWSVPHLGPAGREDGSWIVGSPAVNGGRVYVGSSDGHDILAFDAATGRTLWRSETQSNILASPLLVGDALIAATIQTSAPWGDLLALDPASGAIRWRLRLDGGTWSSPAAADGEIYLGTEAGTVLAVHEVNARVPRLAVYYDTMATAAQFADGGRLAFEYFRTAGYEVLGRDSLSNFLTSRAADSVPSVVVFAIDALPDARDSSAAFASTVRRYLESGGKIVWFLEPIGAIGRDSLGRINRFDLRGLTPFAGVSTATMGFDAYTAIPTPAGRAWGLTRAVRGSFPLSPSAVTTPLALDEAGKATAWVQNFRADRPGTGFVQLWGIGTDVERLPMIRAVAEYGILRRAH